MRTNLVTFMTFFFTFISCQSRMTCLSFLWQWKWVWLIISGLMFKIVCMWPGVKVRNKRSLEVFEPVEIIVDHPFMFTIIWDGFVLFVGSLRTGESFLQQALLKPSYDANLREELWFVYAAAWDKGFISYLTILYRRILFYIPKTRYFFFRYNLSGICLALGIFL